jgi:hypothetical protein
MSNIKSMIPFVREILSAKPKLFFRTNGFYRYVIETSPEEEAIDFLMSTCAISEKSAIDVIKRLENKDS